MESLNNEVTLYLAKNKEGTVDNYGIFYYNRVLALLNSSKFKADFKDCVIDSNIHSNSDEYRKYIFEILLTKEELKDLGEKNTWKKEEFIISRINKKRVL